MSRGRFLLGASLLAFAITELVYFPVLWGSFVNLDEELDLIYNPHIRDLGWANLKWMWTAFYNASYQPLSWMLLALIYRVRGLEPSAFHLVSLLLHATNAAIVCLIIDRLLEAASGKGFPRARAVAAAAGALLFSLHPQQVVTVASASALADLLSSWFFLVAFWLYLRASPPRRSDWTCSLTLFVCSALTRWEGFVLPVVLVILDVFPFRRLSADPKKWLQPSERRILIEKIPFFIVSAGTILLYIAVKHTTGGMRGSLHPIDAAFGLIFFLQKFLFPVRMLPIYVLHGRFDQVAGSPGLCAAAVLVLTLAFWALRKRWPAGLAAWACYVLAIIPPLLVRRNGWAFASMHYAYLPFLGFSALAAAAVFLGLRAREKIGAAAGLAPVFLAVPILSILAVLSWRNIRVYRDPAALWSYVLTISPQSPVAHGLITVPLMRAGRFEEALVHFQKAIELDPISADTRYNYGVALFRLGRVREAADQFAEASRLAPDDREARENLQLALEQSRRR